MHKQDRYTSKEASGSAVKASCFVSALSDEDNGSGDQTASKKKSCSAKKIWKIAYESSDKKYGSETSSKDSTNFLT